MTQSAIDSDWRGIAHEILKLTLRSGEEFAVDLAGAQYGYPEPVMRWQEYKELRILMEHFGSGDHPPKPLRRVQIVDYSLDDYIRLVDEIRKIKPRGLILMDILEGMNINMVEWQMDQNFSIKTMLKFPEERFQKKRDDQVNYIHWKMDNPIKKYHTVNDRRLKKEVPRKWVHDKE